MEKKQWEFKCPVCSSPNRIAQIVTDEDLKLGRLSDKINTGVTNIREVPITDPTKQPKVGDEVSVLVVFFDICEDCGTEYIFKVVRDLRQVRMDVSHLAKPSNIRLPEFRGKN